jgi:hypothetical protein
MRASLVRLNIRLNLNLCSRNDRDLIVGLNVGGTIGIVRLPIAR